MGLNGLVEYIDALTIRGWAFDSEVPEDHLAISVDVGGTVIGEGSANILRKDLVDAGIGSGDHAFDIRLARPLANHELRVAKVQAQSKFGKRLRLPLEDSAVRGDSLNSEGSASSPAAHTKLALFPLPETDALHRPVFVLGAARSGTSAITQGLLKCGEFEGFEEGHFLWMLQKFLAEIRSFYESNGDDASPNRFTMLAHVPYTYMTSAAKAIFIAATQEMFPSGRWIEKTPRPEMTEVAGLMLEIWPNARYIFLKRRGIENVISRLRKFSQVDFVYHCNDWRRSMEAWLRVRDLLGASALEVEQLAVAQEPRRVADEIGRFLGLRRPATDVLASSLEFDLPERTSEATDQILNIGKLDWTVEQITTFREICGPMMAAFNYSFSETYFAAATNSVSYISTSVKS